MTDVNSRGRSRRRLLAAVGSSMAVGAGCVRLRDDDDDARGGITDDSSADATPTRTGTPTRTPIHSTYETTEVVICSPDGAERGRVTAAVADTDARRYTGLSDTTCLPEDRGMLFVYEVSADRTFVMRGMEFGIDIVYVGADRTITSIHHAPAPGPVEDGNEQQYHGTGQYVLEVGYEWTAARGVTVGDVAAFTL